MSRLPHLRSGTQKWSTIFLLQREALILNFFMAMPQNWTGRMQRSSLQIPHVLQTRYVKNSAVCRNDLNRDVVDGKDRKKGGSTVRRKPFRVCNQAIKIKSLENQTRKAI